MNKQCNDENPCNNCFADQGQCLEISGEKIHSDSNGICVDHMDDLNTTRGNWYQVCNSNIPTVNIHFQNGPVKERGVNGVTNESLLAVLIHRTKILNDEFPCDKNKCAITYMENALALFNQRTADRQRRGVEGMSAI